MASDIPFSVRIKKGGKADHVRWDHPSGRTIDVCVCSHNVDFTEGCIMHVLEEHEGELDENGKYKDLTKIRAEKDGHLPSGCDYCYALSWNQKSVKVRTVTQSTIEDMQELAREKPRVQDRIIRLGKSTEIGKRTVGGQSMRKTLIDFLELCKEYEARVIFPNKALEFDPVVAKLLETTKSSLFYSIGNDALEVGPVSYGFTQAWRIAQAHLYRNAGVQTSLTLTCDITGSFSHNQKLGYPIKEVLQAHDEGLRLRLLPMRIAGRELAIRATGRSWDELLGGDNGDLFAQATSEYIRDRAYVVKHHGMIEPRVSHPDFTALYEKYDGNRIGACGKADGYEHCDKCALQYGNNVPHIRFPIEELAPVTGTYREPEKSIRSLPLFKGTGVQ
jgi:hypothetical protein